MLFSHVCGLWVGDRLIVGNLITICRRGISQFYGGKSKSFTSLGDVSYAAKDLAKQAKESICNKYDAQPQ